ncbi:(2Fe-2S)-binding protein [Salinisphaera orenii MK-B5]|uniref:(2Fe-2S)-binding protein n=1 Tax=Salinisphaera orenii MK-B5 TaxID=856730 RepID=A0A423PFZ2_9GAMM|nr:(2Fe-2S)-binding protein [Salinisphaera orenii]ROO24551.1 (2Fe-2S)-binding protein [Salinisphaera orenii MK-B5]
MSVELEFPAADAVRFTLEVNGQAREVTAEPRTHLADVLREHCGLTATHLGCEQGVCGACTVQVDGEPVRACLQSASRFAGRDIRTLEAFDDDPLGEALRRAFSEEHALQCGYCTPGMLITARDIVTRLPDADEARIREELAGNLCRCTGYRGIVRAIARVLETHRHETTDGR